MAPPRALFLALALLAATAHAVQLPTAPTMPTAAPITFSAGAAASEEQQAAISRVTPTAALRATRTAVRISSRAPLPSDIPAGTPYAGEFIVIYNEDVPDVEVAAAETRAAAVKLTTAAIEAGQLAVAEGADVEALVTVVSTTPAPAGVPSQALIRVPAELGIEGVRASLSTSPSVAAVVQNRVVRIAQAAEQGACSPAYFAAGVQAKPVSAVAWEGCTGEGIGVAAFGELCGAGMDRFRWTGVYAYDIASGQMVANCVAFRAAEADPARRAALFGKCGVAPTAFAGLPTSACSEAASTMAADAPCVSTESLARFSVKLSAGLCAAAGGDSVMLSGVPCGPANSLVSWMTLTSRACGAALSRPTLDAKQQADWVGQCGVPPAQLAGVPVSVCRTRARPTPRRPSTPTPAPSRPGSAPPRTRPGVSALPRAPLKGGESTANWGMARIGALDGGSVLDASAAIASTGIKVAVLDTGCERTHPDLNVVDFMDFVDAPGSEDHKVDGHGHGTHVGGIIGAKNQGSGVFGVVPGMPLLALKVLGRDGSGPLDGIYKAYAEVMTRVKRGEKIVAINLSLGSPVMDSSSLAVECDWVKKLAALGTVLVAAAGNDGGQYLGGTMPTACPDAVSATSLASDDTPSSFSNLAYNSSPPNIKSKMIIAPGSNIFSTFNGNSYLTLSGTSMATPHVTGAFARCFLAGDCKLGALATTTNFPKLVAASKAVGCSNPRQCGPNWGTDYFFGNALNVRPW